MHFAKHKHSRVYLSHATSVTILWQLSTVNRAPKAAQGTSENGLQGGRWVAAQKQPQQHLARETSLLGVARSPTSVARAPFSGSSLLRLRLSFDFFIVHRQRDTEALRGQAGKARTKMVCSVNDHRCHTQKRRPGKLSFDFFVDHEREVTETSMWPSMKRP